MNADMKNQNIIQQKKVKQQPKKTPNFGKKISVHNSTLFSTIMTHYYTFCHITKKFLEKSDKYTPQFLLLLSK